MQPWVHFLGVSDLTITACPAPKKSPTGAVWWATVAWCWMPTKARLTCGKAGMALDLGGIAKLPILEAGLQT